MVKKKSYPDLVEFNRMLLGLEGRSPRDVAILGAAFLDAALERSIDALVMDRSGSPAPELFAQNSPLSTLSSKVVAARSLGLISTQAEVEMDQFRKVRNAFAHSLSDLDLADSPIRDHIANFTLWCNKEVPDQSYWYRFDPSVVPVANTPPGRFTFDGKEIDMATSRWVVDQDGTLLFYVPVCTADNADSHTRLLFQAWGCVYEAICPAVVRWLESDGS